MMQSTRGIMLYLECTNNDLSLDDVNNVLKNITRDHRKNYVFFASGVGDFHDSRTLKFYMLDKNGDAKLHLYCSRNSEQKMHAYNNMLREIRMDKLFPLNGFDNMSLPPCFVHVPRHSVKPVFYDNNNVVSMELDFNSNFVKFPMDITYCYHNDVPLNFSAVVTEHRNERIRIECMRIVHKLLSSTIFEIHTINDCLRNRLERIPSP